MTITFRITNDLLLTKSDYYPVAVKKKLIASLIFTLVSYFAPERSRRDPLRGALGKIKLEAHYKETSKEKSAIKLKLRSII